jgi:hypothetical protein
MRAGAANASFDIEPRDMQARNAAPGRSGAEECASDARIPMN